MKTRTGGFTLLELLLVLVLVGIGTALAIVSVGRLADRVAEAQWSDRTQHAVRQLRNKSVLSAKPVHAELDFERGEISFGDRPILTLPAQYKYRHAENALANSGNPPPSLEMLFYPDGTMAAAQFIFVAPSGAEELFRLENISGRVRRTKLVTPQ